MPAVCVVSRDFHADLFGQQFRSQRLKKIANLDQDNVVEIGERLLAGQVHGIGQLAIALRDRVEDGGHA